MNYNIIKRLGSLIILILLTCIIGCNEKDDPLAPYSGSPILRNITIEQNSYNPKITWLGGYVTTLAINKGSEALVDSSLIWMAHAANDNLTYPSNYGLLKSTEENLTESYGGVTQSSLKEDNIYTFWLAKEKLWNVLSSNVGKVIIIDSLLSEDNNLVSNDTIYVAQYNYSMLTYSLDVFINVDESRIQNRGRLGTIYIEQTDISNNLNISWEFSDLAATDLRIAAIGICEGQQFDINNQLWDLYSVEQVNNENVYGSINMLSQPLSLGNIVEGTRTFYEFPSTGLERNKDYYLWIATNEWDGESRGRTANGYATITFTTL